MSYPFFLEFPFGFHNWKDIIEVIMIPVALAVVATFIPHQWQARKRDSETKMQLVADISQLVMTTVMTPFASLDDRKAQCKSPQQMEQDLNEVLKAWRIQTCVINSKIHAYFPTAKAQGTLLHLQWKKFSARVEEYYQEWRERFNAAESEYWEGRRELLFGEKSAIIISILSSKITGFQHKPGI